MRTFIPTNKRAYKALLETSEPRYDSIAAKTGRGITHVYQRLRLAELIPDTAEVFQANQITAGHAVLISRLPQDQQKEALAATFREDWRTKEKHAIPVRELAQCIRENVTLTLAEAVFDRVAPTFCLQPGLASRVRSVQERMPLCAVTLPRTTAASTRRASRQR